jgi:hypothetical protein
MTAHSTGQAPAAGPASTPTAVTDAPVTDASKRRPSHPAQPTRWQRRTYSFGRYAVIAIPVFALIAGLLPRSSAAFSLDPAVYAHYLATGRWTAREAIATVGLGVTGVVSIVGLASLLFRGRARGYALAGLIAGLAGSAGMLTSVGSTVIREDRLRTAFVHGHWSQLAFNARTTGAGTAALAVGGAFLLTLGWILLGVAIIRTSGMNRADGPILIISTPLIFLGGMVLHVLPTMGSFLLLAAGLGIVVTASRISVIGEETWRQRRRRPAIALTGPAVGPSAIATADADDLLDRAPGLAGSLGLARPQLFPAERVGSATIYHAPVVSAAEATDFPDTPTVVPATADPVTAGSSNGSNGGASSNGGTSSNSGTAPEGRDPSPSSGQNGGGQNGGGQNRGGQNGGGDGPPAGKSLRDLLRGARDATTGWPVYRSRPGATNTGSAARRPGARTGNGAGATKTNDASNSNGRGAKGTNPSPAVGRSPVNAASNGGPRPKAGTGGSRTTKPPQKGAPSDPAEPPSRTGDGKPDPSNGSPTAQE